MMNRTIGEFCKRFVGVPAHKLAKAATMITSGHDYSRCSKTVIAEAWVRGDGIGLYTLDALALELRNWWRSGDECFRLSNIQSGLGWIELRQRGRNTFDVYYGKQIDAGLDYATAAKKLGEAIMHDAACAGRLKVESDFR